MAKKKRIKIELSKEDIIKMNKSASRQANIDAGITPYNSKVHKDKSKEIPRKKKHKNKNDHD